MTGSAYLPIVLPIVAFVAMACWLGMVFYADSHPGYRSPKPHGSTADTATGRAEADQPAITGTAPGDHERIDAPESTGAVRSG